MFMDKKGGISKFSVEIFCLTVPKIYVVEPFNVSLVSDNEKFCSSVGYVTVFRRKTFVLQFRNLSWRNPSMLCLRKFLVPKKFMDKREGEVSRFSFEIFCLTVPKKVVGEHLKVTLNSGTRFFVEFFFV